MILGISLLLVGFSSYSQVTITEANLSNICVDGGYYLLGDILIEEQNNDDFPLSGTVYLTIQLPANFEFRTTQGDLFYTDPGTDFNGAPSYSVGTNAIEISYAINNTGVINRFRLTNFEIKAISPVSSGDITRTTTSSGTDATITGAPIGAVFGTLSSAAAPTITSQPSSEIVCDNDNVSFSVTASSGGVLSYQWQRDDNNDGTFEDINLSTPTFGESYSNFNSATLNITNAPTSINGFDYRVVVTGACLPIVASDPAQLTVNTLPLAPSVTNQTQEICVQGSFNLPVASGTGGTFNWYSGPDLIPPAIHTGDSPSAVDIGFNNSVDGTTTVYVTETSAQGCESQATEVSLIVKPLPNNGLTVTPSSSDVCDGNTLTFTVGPTQSGVNYQLFDQSNTPFSATVGGNGTSINITSDAFLFGSLGATEDITVKATNPTTTCSVDLTDVETITINEVPIADAGTGGNECDLNFTFNASASVGTGTWSLVSGAGTITGFSTSANDPTATVTVDAYGTYTFRWSENNNGCTDSQDITVNFYQNPPTANAGSDIDQCDNSTFTMAANSAGAATGSWSEVTATGVTITNINSPTTTVTGLAAGNTATLRWTISNGSCTPTSDEVIIRNDLLPTASAGSDAEICVSDGSYTFSGTTSANGSILWTTSGSGTFGDDTAENPTYTPSAADETAGSVTLTKTVTTAFGICTPASDDMVLTITPTPPTANAGSDIDQCDNSTFTMAANSAGAATGSWSEVTATGVTITNINSPTTTVTGLAAGNTATLRWTISNGSCTPTSDEVIIRNDLLPTASAGSDAEICVTDGSYTFSGTTSANGTISWSTSGDGGFSSTTAENPTYTPGATDNSTGSVTLTKTVTTAFGICTPASDDMVLTITPTPPTANAGSDIDQCDNSTFTMAANSAGAATGSWSEVTATGVTITNINSSTTTVTGLAAGNTATLRWTISNGSCTPTSDEVIIRNDLLPTASAGSDAEICVTDGSYTFSGTTSANGSILWTTSGSGTFGDDTAENPTYTPSAADETAGSVTLTKTVTTAFGICTPASDDMVLTITPTPPTANAGSDIDQCDNSTFTMAANSAGAATGSWSEVTATGVTITNINSPTTTVTGLAAGNTATLRWTISNGSCTPTSDEVIIRNDLLPTASAGSDAEICVTDGSYTFSGTTSANGTISWSTSGDGGFSSTTAENPTYTPGATDNSTGSVTLTKTLTTAFGICTPASDDMVLTITPTPPTANAGSDIEQCDNSTFTMAANSAGVGTGTWSIVSGTGISITNINSPTTTVTGLAAGNTATLRWTISNGSCTPTSDEVIIRNDLLPTASAGSDAEICVTDGSYTFSGTTSANGSILWTTSGSGTFGDDTAENPTYTPSAADETAGSVTLTKTVTTAFGICTPASDDMVLTITPTPPTANAGSDIDQCDNSTFTMAANSAGAAAGSWSEVTATGVTITNINSPTTTVTGLAAGNTATLRWTISNGSCTPTSDEVIIRNDLLPTASAGSDAEICVTDGSYTFSGTTSANGTISWSTSGDGGFSSTTAENPTYSPGATDNSTGSVTLTKTLTTAFGICTPASDDMVLTITPTPPTANAGSDIDQCDNSTFTMAANSAGAATGSWSEVTATGVTITNINSPTTTVTGLAAGNTATLRWTISNGSCTPTSDEVIIRNDLLPTASAGSDAEICVTDGSYTFSGTTSSNGTISWSTSGDGGFSSTTAENPTYTPGATDNSTGSVTLTKTLTTAFGSCTPASDDMVLTITPTPPTANAGSDIDQCDNSTFTMAANSAGVGTGTWSIVSGTGISITNINSPTTTVTGLAAGNTATLRWTISNGSCTPTSDEVIIRNDLLPTASAGSDAEICVTDGSYTFSGTTSSNGTISWSTSGDGGFSSTTAENPTYSPGATDNSTGSVTLTKTVTTAFGICTPASDDMVLTITPTPPTANAGSDIDQCDNSTFTMAANSAGAAAGSWSEVTATGVTITNINSPTTTITGLAAGNTATLRWTISNGSCTPTSDEVIIRNDLLPTASAGSDAEICVTDGSYTFSDTTSSNGTISWSTSGDGGFSSTTAENPTYTPGATDNSTGSVTLTKTVTTAFGICTPASDDMVLTITPTPPTANAGSDIDQCDNSTFTMAANSAGAATGSWSEVTATGVTITNINSPTTTVTGLAAGNTATLRWTISNGSCTPTSDEVIIRNDLLPTASAGSDAEICVTDGSYTFSGTTSSNGTISWSTSGDGGFSSTTAENPTYTPGATDNSTGSVTLTKTVTTAFGICTPASDDMVLTITPTPPTANAGSDIDQCDNSTFTMAANSAGAATGSWSEVTATGVTITNINSPTTTVTGLAAGNTATLRWTISNGSCTPTSDEVIIRNDLLPTASAGSDAEICVSDGSYTFSGTTSSNGTISWSTSGDGGFSSTTAENPTYTPGATDNSTGSVTLTKTVTTAFGICTPASDDMVLTITPTPPTANAGSDIDQCDNSTFTMAANSAGAAAGSWSEVTATGVTITNINSPTTTVTGLAAGNTATLRWTISNGSCTPTSDEVIIRNDLLPTASAGSDAEICVTDGSYTFSGTTSSNGSILWTTSGSGTFGDDTAENPTYTPSAADETAGSVTLTKTVTTAFGICTPASDDMVLTITPTPPTANAGSDIDQCDNSTFTMAANSAGVGTGTWSIVSGTGISITNINSPTTTVTGLAAGNTATLRWTISNGSCTPTSDEVIIRNDLLPTASAGSDAEICVSDGSYTFSGTTSANGSILWTTSGSGTFGDDTAENPTYTPSAADETAGSVTLTKTVTTAFGICTPASDDMVLTITPTPPTANAGSDIDQCDNSTFTMAANSAGAGTGSWSEVTATGVTITNINSPTTTVTGLAAGNTATLRWTISNGSCTPTSDEVIIRNDLLPTASAGSDAEICVTDGSYTFSGTTSSNGTISWSTSGDGGFSSTTAENPTYTPGATDNSTGSVTLTKTVTTAFGICTPASDDMVLTITPTPPTANAGSDIEQCANSTFTMAANSAGAATGSWSEVTATGVTITNINSPTTTVTGLAAGNTATLRWTISNGSCTPTSDEVIIRNDLLPTASAGSDAEICVTDGSYTFSGTTSSNGSILWTTSGSGTFGDDTAENPTYTPSAADETAGSVTLTKTVTTAFGICTPASDDMVLTITPTPPTANAGSDIEQCDNSTFTMAANSAGAATGSWSEVTATGVTITNINSPTTTVTGLAAGNTATLRWTISNGSCTPTSDEVIIRNDLLPTASAGSDAEICVTDGSYTFSGTTSANGTISWSTSGDGGFSSTTAENPTYTPGATDNSTGSVTLTKTVTTAFGICTPASDDMVLTITPTPPTANAGSDIDQCDNSTFTMAANSAGAATGSWSEVTATGVTITNINSPTTTVTGLAAGNTATLRWTISNGSCTPTSDEVIIRNDLLPTASAGSDAEICVSDGSYTFSGTTSANGTISWSTSGDGSFSSTTAENPTYTPGATDNSTGSVTLTKTVTTAFGICTPASDDMVLTITPTPPTANAGSDIDQCDNSTFTMAANSAGAATGSWSEVTATGVTITNINSPTTTVTGLAAGNTATLRWTISNGSCTPTSDEVIIRNDLLPTASAGSDAEICVTDGSYTFSGTTSANGSILWTTSGSGTFGDDTAENPTYTPSAADETAGSVTLTKTVTTAFGICTPASDDMVLTITPTPQFAPVPTSISACAGELIDIDFNTVTGGDNITWSADNTAVGNSGTAGGASLTFVTAQNNTTSDIVTTFTVSASNSICTTPVTTSFTITIKPTPDINNFFPPTEVCENETNVDLAALGITAIPSGGTFTFAGPGVSGTSFDATSVPSGIQEIEVTYTLNGCSKTEEINLLEVIAEPTANAGIDDEVCENTTYNITDASVTNSAGILWTHDGAGTITNPTTLNASYTPNPTDAGSNVTLTLTVDGFSACADAIDTKILAITAEPTANAGADDEVCENTTFTVSDAVITNSAGIIWTTDGDGILADANTASPTYTPDPLDAGSNVTLTLTVSGNGSCADAVDTKVLAITAEPTANAGADDEVCENTTFTVSDAVITNSAGITWTTDGDGILADANTASPTYTPDPLDAGSNVTLTLTVSGNGSCADAVDTKVLAITAEPTANAGADDEVCENTTFTVSDAVITNSAGITWTTDGDGILADANTASPTYTPDPLDAGSNVTLTLTVSGNGSCADAVDTKVLAITAEPTANAGADDEVCENTAFTVSDAVITNSAGITWTTDGDGILADANTASPTYTPDPLDAGSNVTLTLTVSGNGSCADAVDTKVLAITAEPTANAGADDEVCENTAFTVSDAVISNSAGITWTTDGDGILADANTASPTYTPDPLDAGSNVTLTLTVSGNGSCVDAVDTKVLAITAEPTANAGADDEVCENTAFTVSDAVITNSAGITWTTDGDGILADANTASPTYTPDPLDAGSNVTLTLTVSGNGSCVDAVDTKVLAITAEPTANAGAATAETCVNSDFQVTDASVTNENTFSWSEDGDGAFDDPNIINPTYTPAASDAGATVTFTLTATGNGSCATVIDTKVLSITPEPTANAGAATAEACVNSDFQVTDASVTNENTFSWSEDGDGAFDDPNIINPTYTPAASDAGATVTFTLTATGNGSCATVIDTKVLSITPEPIANAGAATAETCVNSDFQVTDASVTNENTFAWSEDGDGAFDDPNIINPNYTPAASDAGATITFTLTATGNGSCATVIDTKVLSITPEPTANAGAATAEACVNSDFQVTDASVTNENTFFWSEDGDGAFDDPNIINPTYTPAVSDAGAAVTFTLTASGNGSCATVIDTKVLSITPEPTANAGADDEVCENTTFTVSDAVITNSAGITWTTDGDGILADANTASPTYTPDPLDAGSNVTLTLTISGNGSCADAVDTKVLAITAEPTANAGADDEVCENTAFTVSDAVITNSAGITWTTDGDGIIADANTASPTYTPDPLDAGSNVTLTLTVSGNGSCADAVDTKVLAITAEPTANAGADDEVCENTAFTVSDAVISNSAGITWTTDGDGILADANTASPTYTPDPLDAGSNVTLTLTVSGNGSCVDAVDTKVLAITAEPTANAGAATAETCVNSDFQVTDASVTNENTFSWSEDGDGAFDDPNIINPTYTPAASDAGATVTFTLTATGNGSCGTVIDTKVLSITPEPTANAGAATAEACVNSDFQVTDATVTNENTFSWSEDGDGAFDDPNIINPTYTPTASDAGATVTFTLTASGNGSCATVIDTKVLSITPEPIANAGADDEVCENTAFTVSDAVISNSAGITWTTDGDGILADANTASPTYTPDPLDAGSNVTLTLTVNGNGSCVDAVDTKVLTISELPVANIITTATEVCEDDPFTLTGTISGGATTGLWRIKSGQPAGASTSGNLSSTSESSGNWNATFTPNGDYLDPVIFEFVASSSSSCSDAIDEITLNIRNLPVVSNQNYTYCEDTAGGGESIQDLTTYNVDITTENPTDIEITWYSNSTLTSQVADETSVAINNNDSYFAKIQLKGTNCFDVARADFTVNPQIVIEAGSDAVICDGEVLDLSTLSTLPKQSNATDLLWTTTGDGTFDLNDELRPIYTPGANDLSNSPIILTLTGSNSTSCPDVQDQMQLTINPIPVITAVSDKNLCPGDSQADIIFDADIDGGDYTWSATNSSQLGLGVSSGSGNFPAVTAQSNNTGNIITSVVTIDYILNDCNAATKSFNINVNPTPIIDNIEDIDVCPGETVSINFNANTSGEVFTWNKDTNIVSNSALPSSGAGDISFTAASNNSGSPITSEFTYSASLNGCTSVVKSFKVNVLPEPQLDPISPIVVCSFDNIVTNFTSDVAGTSYSWTNDNTATGIPAAGNGNINRTAAENISGANRVSNIIVTATANGCVSTTETFTVTVLPKPVLGTQGNLEICPGESIPSINLSDDSNGNSTITWTATNAAAIGLPSGSGTDDIPAFTSGSNNSTSTITSNITVTSEWNGCVSDQLNFQIQLKPNPIMNAISDAQLCSGDLYSVNFGNSLGGSTSYSWTNDNPAIGLASSGTSNISFTTAANTTGANIVSNIIVTPTNNGCEGPAETFTLTLKPTPVLSNLSNLSACSEESISIPFTVDLTNPLLSVSSSDNSLFQGGLNIVDNNIEFTTAINTSGTDKTATITLNATKDGCTNLETFELTLKYRPVVSAIPDRALLCPGEIVSGQIFSHDSGTGTFSWEITNPDIIGDATASSGTGNLPSFTAADNFTGSVIESYVRYFSTRNGCLSEADSFKISIKPAPIITNSDLIFCDDDNVNITFENNTSTLNSSGNVTYYWTNDNPTIGVNNTSGTTADKITSGGFPANAGSGTSDNIAFIEVYAEIDGCVGPSKTFEVRVKPLPVFTTPDASFSQMTCSGDTFTFEPTADIPSTQFNWNLISNPGNVTGATASGNGNISLDLVNTTNTLQSLTYEISTINDACAGEIKTLSIDVYPELNLTPLPPERVACSGSSFQINLSTTNNVDVAGEDLIYEWEVSSNNVGATNGSGTELIQTLTNTNTTGEGETVNYYIRPTLNNGLCVGPRDTIQVIVNPEAVVFAGNDTTICQGEQVLLNANISKGASSGSWSGGTGTFTNRNSLSTFYSPSTSEIGTVVTFTFTSNDPTGPCSAVSDQVNVTIDELPTALIVNNPFPTGEYCVRDERLLLEGNNKSYADSTAYFTGNGVIYDSSDSLYYFDPRSATVGGPYTIEYFVENQNGCENKDEVIVEVTNGLSGGFRVINAPIVENGYVVCFNQTGVELVQDERSVTGQFSGPGVEFNALGLPVFNPEAENVTDTSEVTFSIEDPATGCISDSTVTIVRLPKPSFDIQEAKVCDPERPYTITINDITTYNNDFDQITGISFNQVDDNTNRITNFNGDTISFNTPGAKLIEITWEFKLACSFTEVFEVNVGNIESIDFSITNIKATVPPQDGTAFNINEDIAGEIDPVYTWSFGDGSPEVTTEEKSILHNYTQAGNYNIRLLVTDQYGCTKNVTKSINIVPAISAANLPYRENFEETDGAWFTTFNSENRADSSSWIYKTSSSAFDNEINSTNYWMTAINNVAGYQADERSYLVGPTFDLSSLSKPVLAFDMYLDFENGDDRSGAIVEYTNGDGNWYLLGNIEDELNWYNESAFIDFAENDNNRSAWLDTADPDESADETPWKWVRVAHKLDNISDKNNITFRITFNSDNYNDVSLGMAVDNFYVGERQKLVLLENFTNLNSSNYNSNRSNVENLMSSEYGKDILPMNFHISIPLPDAINLKNSVQLDARANMYSIEESPQLVVDGEQFNSEILATDNTLNDELIQKVTRRSLLEPSNLINVRIDEGADKHTVRFDATLSPNTDTTSTLISYFFVIEKTIPENNQLNNIVRKILPNINGINLNKLSQVSTNSYEWEVNSMYTNDDLAVVSIVQNRSTNSIIEINIDDINQAKIAKTITSIETGFESLGLSLYPNPSRGNLYLEFEQALKSDLKLLILDTNGKIVKSTTVQSGTSKTELDLNGIASGVYHIISKDSNGNLNRKKIVLID